MGFLGGILGAIFVKTIGGVFKLASAHNWLTTKRGYISNFLS
jgi:hypothetical protein